MHRAHEPYLTLTEPNGTVYDIYFHVLGGNDVAQLIARDSENEMNVPATVQLKSFVGPNGKTYQIERNIHKNNGVPELGILHLALQLAKNRYNLKRWF